MTQNDMSEVVKSIMTDENLSHDKKLDMIKAILASTAPDMKISGRDYIEHVSGGVAGTVGQMTINNFGSGHDTPTQPIPSNVRPSKIAVIRELLTAAFNAEGLRRFCLDRPSFQPVYHQTNRSIGLYDVVDRLIDHCNEQVLFNELLSEIEKVNPRQYAVFESRLKQ